MTLQCQLPKLWDKKIAKRKVKGAEMKKKEIIEKLEAILCKKLKLSKKGMGSRVIDIADEILNERLGLNIEEEKRWEK